ncbi:DUF2335 domain-containing protein [Gemella sp. zg-1178]|uniref:DUF2335 domain-containing protein n=1 Tax=Gemella sp. zg-1178 TaxID=2840372 RepID=UPI001C04644C|nr:DUF2335 domain-containing protein [Gemella sp. zg-1178]MBU0279228.1 DUF2335 domain-containing protein [Gemella sp. zg-1178]
MTSKKDIAKNNDINKIQKQIEALSKKDKLLLLQKIEITEEYSGMLPPPAMLKEFDNIIPNGADRLMKLLEVEVKERHENNKIYLKYTSVGLYLAFALAIGAFIGGFYLAVKGNNIGTAILIGSVLSGVIISFIKGK